MVLRKNFTFIDLFAGIGGFHCAMNNYSNGKAKCLMASEINQYAKRIYEDNFNMECLGDIQNIKKDDITDYCDVVCGGFPCQTFSKAGMQKGFGDPRGTLFREIVRLIENDDIEKQPKILILENVSNLINHDKGVTWNTIKKALIDINYNVINTPLVVGPKDFNIPQLRERAIILAVRKDIYDGEINISVPKVKNNSLNIFSIVHELDEEEHNKYKISDHDEMVLNCWDDFIHGLKYVPVLEKRGENKTYIKKNFDGVIGFPIWAFEFNKSLELTENEKLLPVWKQDFILKNRHLYEFNKKFIKSWLRKWNNLEELSHTEQKMEWQCGKDNKSVWDGIIQFRTSGVRIKQPTESPTLVAMVHLPIIGKYKRYITVKEAAKLQSFPNDFDFSNETDFHAYMQLGNAVNVKVVEKVFSKFIEFLDKNTKKEKNK